MVIVASVLPLLLFVGMKKLCSWWARKPCMRWMMTDISTKHSTMMLLTVLSSIVCDAGSVGIPCGLTASSGCSRAFPLKKPSS